MPEIVATLDAIHKTEKRRNKFMAALQGVDLDEATDEDETKNKKPATLQEVQARAIARLTGDQNLAGAIAEGFTPDMGVQYMMAEGTEIG